jgi:hypothetical protein
MRKRLSIGIFLLSVNTAMAQGPDVDWKLYGSISSNDSNEFCFFEARGVSRRPDGNVRVWTKCILQKDLDSIDIEKDADGKILDHSARKVANHYVPPIATIEDSTADQQLAVIRYEETANNSSLTPTGRIFYELDCTEQTIRELSINIRGKGSSDQPRAWKHISPEGNGWRLSKLICTR